MRFLVPFLLCFIIVFVLDQAIKWFFVSTQYGYDGPIISLVLVYNKGVAFSMFAFLQEWLKYIQIALLFGIFLYLLKNKELFRAHTYPIGIIFGAGASNILDRFMHEGVVDYIYWHYKFNFAVFNFADVMINIGVAILLYQVLFKKKSK